MYVFHFTIHRAARLLAWGVIGMALGLPPCPSLGQTPTSPDQRFVQGLRQRRLYDLADEYCRRQLAEAGDEPIAQVDLVLQWVQTRVARAVSIAPSQRTQAWQDAHAAAQEFIAKNPDHPRIVLVALQDALTWLAEGELRRREWELQPDPTVQQQAAATLRRASQELANVQRQIDQALSRGAVRRGAGELQPAELLALSNHAAFEIARGFQNIAALFAADDRLNRIDALTKVDGQLAELNGKVPREDPLWWRIQLLRSECLRMLGQVAEAAALWSGIPPAEVPEAIAAAWWSEQIRLALAGNDPDRMVRRLSEVGTRYQTDADLSLALVELFLAESNRQTDARETERWQQRASQLLQSIQTHHGDYWARRANLLVARLAPSSERLASTDLILRLASELLKKNEPDEAVRILDLAAQRATESQPPTAAADLSFQAAAIRQRQRQHADAADRFRLFAAAYPDDARAPEAHLAAIWNTAQLVGDDPDRLNQYAGLLREHLQDWPESATSAQAALWLAPLLLRGGQFEEALAVLTIIPRGSPSLESAQPLARQAALRWLRCANGGDAASPRSTQKIADTILGYLKRWTDTGSNSPENAPPGVLAAQFLQTQIDLAFRDDQVDPAIETLQSLTAESHGGQIPFADEARMLLALCLATRDDPAGTAQLKLGDADSAELWLRAWRRLANDANRQSLSRLIIAAAQENPDALTSFPEELQLQWRLAIAESYWRVGEKTRGLAEFQQAIRQFPRSLAARIALARTAGSSAEPEHQSLALATWRTVAAGTRPQSDEWFEAKYQVARLLLESGNRDEAAKLLRYLKTVPPGWDGSSLKPLFEQLLQQTGD
jgi:TolA-binding protein